MNKIYIGIDNGTSGSIGVVGPGIELFFTPATKQTLAYTSSKAGKTIRIDHPEFRKQIKYVLDFAEENKAQVMVLFERPMVNATRFTATKSALRCFESELICIEELEIPYEVIDSKKWQKLLLPAGLKKSEALKFASLEIGSRLFPKFKDEFKKQKDADGMLIAEWARRGQL